MFLYCVLGGNVRLNIVFEIGIFVIGDLFTNIIQQDALAFAKKQSMNILVGIQYLILVLDKTNYH